MYGYILPQREPLTHKLHHCQQAQLHCEQTKDIANLSMSNLFILPSSVLYCKCFFGLEKRWICIVRPLPSLETKIKKINRKCCHCSTEGRLWQWRMPSLWLPTVNIFQPQDLISYVNSISRLHINAGITCLLLCVTGGTVRQSHNQRRICLAGGGKLAVANRNTISNAILVPYDNKNKTTGV